MTPDVSVVIPTRDRFALLASAGIPSALGQREVEVEVLIVDDGSSDGTAERVRDLGDSRIRVIRRDRAEGVAAARNAGVRAAAAPWVAFLDDDDLWAPRKLATQLEALAEQRASFAYCTALVVEHDGTPSELLEAPAASGLRSALLRRNIIPAGSSNVIAATELVRRLDGFDEELSLLADWDLWIRFALEGKPAACAEPLVAYVRHQQRMRISGRDAMRELERLHRRHGAAGFAPDRGRVLSWVAGDQRRAGRRAQALGTYLGAVTSYRDLRWLPQIVATPFDRAGAGLKNRLRRRDDSAPEIARPDWIPTR